VKLAKTNRLPATNSRWPTHAGSGCHPGRPSAEGCVKSLGRAPPEWWCCAGNQLLHKTAHRLQPERQRQPRRARARVPVRDLAGEQNRLDRRAQGEDLVGVDVGRGEIHPRTDRERLGTDTPPTPPTRARVDPPHQDPHIEPPCRRAPRHRRNARGGRPYASFRISGAMPPRACAG